MYCWAECAKSHCNPATTSTGADQLPRTRHKPEHAPSYPNISALGDTRHPFPNTTSEWSSSANNLGEDKTKQYKQMEPHPSIRPTLQELRMPEMGDYFLKQPDRRYIINITDTIISSIPSVDGIKNLLRGKLPDSQINRINFRDGSRSIAETIIGNLEGRGALNSPHYHALGAFLKDLIEDDYVSFDTAVHIVKLLFGYALIKDREKIAKLSDRFQVAAPIFLE